MKTFALFLFLINAIWFFNSVESTALAFAKKIGRLGIKFIENGDVTMIANGATLTSLYVGVNGIWYRSSVIAAINELERGEKEAAMESLNIAIATLAVFDVTQASVKPLASKLMSRMIKAKGFFRKTFKAMTDYNSALPGEILKGGNYADDVMDYVMPMKHKIKNAFDSEVTEFLKNSQGYEDLVTSLNGAKKWAKALKWFDVLSGPIFDAANSAFCAYQLHLAITDPDLAPEVRALSIASASFGIASGIAGIASFVVGALAAAGTTLAAVAGPVGGIIGCLLSFTAIIIDFINSYNPYGAIKDQLEALSDLKAGTLLYLDNHVSIASNYAQNGLNTGFDTIYEVNQAALIDFRGVRVEGENPWKGIDRDQMLEFNMQNYPGMSNYYLVKGRERMFDKSKYANIFFHPKGTVSIGYDFYGKYTTPVGLVSHKKGVTVRLNTAMIARKFWTRGVSVNTAVANDEVSKNPDNVILGDMTGLADSNRLIRVYTGAGDDVLQLTGLICNSWTAEKCISANMGTGINTFSLRGMSSSQLQFQYPRSSINIISFRYKLFPTSHEEAGDFYMKQANGVEIFVGSIFPVNVFYGSPIDDVVEIAERENGVVKETQGSNTYIIHISDSSRPFTHTIEDDSDRQATVRFNITRFGATLRKDDLRFSMETNTLVVYKVRSGRTDYGKIIFKREGGDQSQHFRVEIPKSRYDKGWNGDLEDLKGNEIGTHDGRNKLVYGVPYKYFMNTKLLEIPNQNHEQCSVFMLEFNLPPVEPTVKDVKHELIFTFSNSYIIISDGLMAKLAQGNYILLYKRLNTIRSEILLEKRQTKSSTDYLYRIRTSVTSDLNPIKAILYGSLGSQELLFDMEHDKHFAYLDLYTEWVSKRQRPETTYRFNRFYSGSRYHSNSLTLGAPVLESTMGTKWHVDLAGLSTMTARNALIVTDSIYSSIDTENGGQFKIIFRPGDADMKWSVDVSKKNGANWEQIHQVDFDGVVELSYEQGLTRSRLASLYWTNTAKEFNLYSVMKPALEILKTPISVPEKYNCDRYINN